MNLLRVETLTERLSLLLKLSHSDNDEESLELMRVAAHHLNRELNPHFYSDQ